MIDVLAIAGVAASLGATIPSVAEEGVGFDASLYMSYAKITGLYDADGKGQKFGDGVNTNFMLLNLNASYNAWRLLPGLYAGLDLPVVTRTDASPGSDASNSGLGDVSFYAGYLAKVAETLRVGGQARLKLATGKTEDLAGDEVPLGSGYTNLQLSALAAFEPMANLLVTGDVGYIVIMEKDDFNPGDTAYLDVGVGYRIAKFTPQLSVWYQNSGNAAEGGNTIDGSDTNALSLGFDVFFAATDTINAFVGLGTSTIPFGANLNYGFPLLGKGQPSSGGSVHLGASGSF